MMRAFLALGTYAVPAQVSEWKVCQVVLFNFSLARQYRHISRSRGLRLGGTRSVLLKAHRHFHSTCSRLRLC